MSTPMPDPEEDPRRKLGALGEHLAAEHLVRRGFRILERNYRTRWGELDIVAFDGTTLAFCEVKTRRLRWRRSAAAGSGAEALDAVGPRKRVQVRKMARSWLTERTGHPFARSLRFDAIGITFDADGRLLRLEHLEDAF
jgi:putative endonuclease